MSVWVSVVFLMCVCVCVCQWGTVEHLSVSSCDLCAWRRSSSVFFSQSLWLPSVYHPQPSLRECVLCVFFPPVDHRWQTMEKDAQRDPERPHGKQQATAAQRRAPPETEAWEHVRLEILNRHQWVNLTLDLTISEALANPEKTVTFILKVLCVL